MEMVESTIDMDLANNHEYVIKPSLNFGEELIGECLSFQYSSSHCITNIDLREQMSRLESKIKAEFKKVRACINVCINCY